MPKNIYPAGRVPYFDPADNKLLNTLTLSQCNELLDSQRAFRVPKHGPIKRLYRLSKARSFNSPAAVVAFINAAASTTERRVRDDPAATPNGLPFIIQHQRKYVRKPHLGATGVLDKLQAREPTPKET